MSFLAGFWVTVGAVGILFLMWKMLSVAEDPVKLVFKWCATIGIIFAILWNGARINGMGTAIMALMVAGLGGATMAIMWAGSLGAAVGSVFGSLYSPGAEMEPEPMYSIAEARRKKGDYQGAVEAIREQLAMFPEDFEGQLKLAEVYVNDMGDLASGESLVQKICGQEHPTDRLSIALNLLADWQLKVGRNRDAARESLEKVISRFPGSTYAHQAEQRIAHLTPQEMLDSADAPKSLQIAPRDMRLGLKGKSLEPVESGSEKQREVDAGALVDHLNEHPNDYEAREKLARAYVTQYNRIELARDQLNLMIDDPSHSQAKRVEWLNMLTDLELEAGSGLDEAKGHLEKIVELFPEAACAARAKSRMSLLKLEGGAGKKKNQAIKLGSYKKNIGLESSD